jgi:hypothetical protein
MADLRPHPDEVTTAAYLDGALVERERDRFESHLAGCDACREGVVSLRVGDDEAGSAPAVWVARARAVPPCTIYSTARIPAWAAAAAATILLAGALALRVPAPAAASRTFRSEPEPAIAPLYPSSGSRVAAGGLRFRWSPIPGADRYRVTLRTTTGETLGRVEVPASQTELAWPGAALPSGTLLWSVEALSLDRVIAASRPTPFTVR